jgi:pimeloyl-ACP methyl ester carboxylesterase
MSNVSTARRHRIRSPLILIALLAAMLSSLFLVTSSAPAAEKAKRTVVLVHGAFADASGWSGVAQRLQRRGYTVLAPANPLRGVAYDAAYLRSFLSSIKGPIVLVGHSYGGFVITNAGTGNPNVKALVYVAAFAPDEGDTVGGLSGREPGSLLLAPGNLTPRTFPTPDGQQAPEGYITPSAFRKVFAADLPKAQTDFMASAQRPAALSSLSEPSGPPAWKTMPSWAVVAGRDNTIGTRNVRFMAKRARAKILTVKRASHVVMISHPRTVTSVVLRAAAGTS